MAEADDEKKRVAEELERGNALRAKSQAEFAERTKGKPTPTQEENDRAALGEHILEHEADGSNPDEAAMGLDIHHRQMEAKPGGGYQTRQSRPVPSRPTTTPSS